MLGTKWCRSNRSSGRLVSANIRRCNEYLWITNWWRSDLLGQWGKWRFVAWGCRWRWFSFDIRLWWCEFLYESIGYRWRWIVDLWWWLSWWDFWDYGRGFNGISRELSFNRLSEYCWRWICKWRRFILDSTLWRRTFWSILRYDDRRWWLDIVLWLNATFRCFWKFACICW